MIREHSNLLRTPPARYLGTRSEKSYGISKRRRERGTGGRVGTPPTNPHRICRQRFPPRPAAPGHGKMRVRALHFRTAAGSAPERERGSGWEDQGLRVYLQEGPRARHRSLLCIGNNYRCPLLCAALRSPRSSPTRAAAVPSDACAFISAYKLTL